jgi:ADP-ribose pyrophosphatase YjhB (NUDIX family)
MKKEKSAGCFVLNNNNEVLLINRVWPNGEDTIAAPKGHQDPGEDIKKTAIRETTEETGYTDISIIEDIEFESETYQLKPGHIKTVYWFLARLNSEKQISLNLTEEELQSKTNVIWMSLDRAEKDISFETQRKNIEKIKEYLL